MVNSIFGPGSQDQPDTRPSRGDEGNGEKPSSDTSTGQQKTLAHVVKYGSLGGFVGTLSMTVFRMPTNKSLPPTARFWEMYVGSGDAEEYPVIALFLHLVYGVVSGICFALLTPGSENVEEIAETKGAVLGTIYGVVLSLFGTRVVLRHVLDADPDTDERLVFHISHIVYGLTLGTWVGSRFGE